MSAAHSRIAKYLLKNEDSVMGLSLRDAQFWETQISALIYIFEDKGLNIERKILKKILMVGLYTSLNGALSEDRLFDNLTLNADAYLTELGISKERLKESKVWEATRETLSSFQLIKEVRKLNETCALKDDVTQEYKVYTIDRTSPYIVDSKHKGISRVLQGFEVVLLSVLLYDVLASKLLPISLDHDGILLMSYKDIDPKQLCQELSSNQSHFSKWSKFY